MHIPSVKITFNMLNFLYYKIQILNKNLNINKHYIYLMKNNKLFYKVSLLFVVLIFFSNLSVTSLGYKQFSNNAIKGTQEKYDLLIITPEVFSEYLLPLANHKNKYDVKTIITTVEEIYTQIYWKGKDDAEKVKYFIKEAIEQWQLKYVLLVGGRKDQSKTETWWVPVRYSYLSRPYGIWPEGKFLTDLYFADIYDSKGNFSSWDDNDNGVFGEWPVDESSLDIPNLYPDICVGRIPCSNVNDVKIVVNKIIHYENCVFDDSWFKKMVVVGGDTYPDKTDFIDGENYTQQALDIMSDFEPVKIWSSLNNLKTKNIVKAINQGCGFIFFSTHGGPGSVSTHPPNNSDEWIGRFGLRNMPFLINNNRLPICTAGSGCFVSMFNVSLGHTDWVYWHGIPYTIPRCWSWSLVRKPYGGCIGVISSTAFSYESPDIDSGVGGCEWLDIHFYEKYAKNNITFLGECWANTITSFLQNFTISWSDKSDTGDAIIAKNCEQWLLIGDPSLKIGGYN